MRIACCQLEATEFLAGLPEFGLASDSVLEVVGGHETVTLVS